MTGIREAKAALQQAEQRAKLQAKAIIDAARIDLGRAILKARSDGIPQKDIAEVLQLTREQVRRLQVAAQKAGDTAES
ncbi:hypothetical protein JOL79_11565 [Microbispora sp. RL4-1S]|uniref:Uncharacterized protein n=1 Tax=Microbispora oryzae TaxID=2806554 RepID=A0A940WJK5_9ACTN|nr:hypothetical protein [Microbispora oryzae]MBP2704452.1 hypothetical protein [Microbispora oryzae]